MRSKTILCPIGPKTTDRFVRQAAELAYEADAHLSLLVMVLAAPPAIGKYAALISDAWWEERERDNAILVEKVAAVNSILTNTSAPVDVDGLYCETSAAASEIGTRALYADLMLLADEGTVSKALRRAAIDGALFHASCPIFLPVADGKLSLAPHKVVLAWDSSPDAAAAARQAIPLMKSARDVHVLMVDPMDGGQDQDETPGTDIATYLARHGIKVTVDRLEGRGRPVATVLLQRAAELSADLLVMGAYGHSRVTERVFGGVTQSMIGGAGIPVLLAR
ncbi:universal stress protein [Ciceribacter azotifigens]|uniref:universal stress protein n=1 Tax=Ciceribacter azotifigens TaxID=2069303 RepID=UPI003A89F4CF